MGFFRRERGNDEPRAEVYESLRNQALHLTPDQLGDAFAEAPILALLMETGYPEAVATLVGMADGTSSLYFSNGVGVIGAGTHAAVAAANSRWLETGVTLLPRLSVITDPPLPGKGITQFVAVTPQGLRARRRARRRAARVIALLQCRSGCNHADSAEPGRLTDRPLA
jgi:hypothetical protein